MTDIYTYPTVNPFNDRTNGRVIGWWSGGVASAVACSLALDRWKDSVEVIFCDTHMEHPDTFRFMEDFEKIVGIKVKRIESDRFHDPESVWRKYLGINFAHGAPCSTALKKAPRLKEQNTAEDFGQVFG